MVTPMFTGHLMKNHEQEKVKKNCAFFLYEKQVGCVDSCSQGIVPVNGILLAQSYKPKMKQVQSIPWL